MYPKNGRFISLIQIKIILNKSKNHISTKVLLKTSIRQKKLQRHASKATKHFVNKL